LQQAVSADTDREHLRSLDRPHIVFVDDDPAVLSGLRRLLRAERYRWDLSFAGDGPSALAILAERPCTVLVSDFRMPGMDGAELLTAVRDRHRGTARVILSGQIDATALDTIRTLADRLLPNPVHRSRSSGAWCSFVGPHDRT
jgi:CheY-like chemotaxis protein